MGELIGRYELLNNYQRVYHWPGQWEVRQDINFKHRLQELFWQDVDPCFKAPFCGRVQFPRIASAKRATDDWSFAAEAGSLRSLIRPTNRVSVFNLPVPQRGKTR